MHNAQFVCMVIPLTASRSPLPRAAACCSAESNEGASSSPVEQGRLRAGAAVAPTLRGAAACSQAKSTETPPLKRRGGGRRTEGSDEDRRLPLSTIAKKSPEDLQVSGRDGPQLTSHPNISKPASGFRTTSLIVHWAL